MFKFLKVKIAQLLVGLDHHLHIDNAYKEADRMLLD